jgi:hypothetical protein
MKIYGGVDVQIDVFFTLASHPGKFINVENSPIPIG